MAIKHFNPDLSIFSSSTALPRHSFDTEESVTFKVAGATVVALQENGFAIETQEGNEPFSVLIDVESEARMEGARCMNECRWTLQHSSLLFRVRVSVDIPTSHVHFEPRFEGNGSASMQSCHERLYQILMIEGPAKIANPIGRMFPASNIRRLAFGTIGYGEVITLLQLFREFGEILEIFLTPRSDLDDSRAGGLELNPIPDDKVFVRRTSQSAIFELLRETVEKWIAKRIPGLQRQIQPE